MTRRLAGLALMLLPALALAQGAAPTLVVTDPSGRSEHLLIQQVAIDVRIVGYLAETRMTLTFANPQGRDLEGDLTFPLPEKATVSGYALDIRGQMVDGVVVEREKARVVFEEIVRQRVDPGLVEWTRGNVFRTRVFPIPAHGTRKVMVRFVSELAGDARGCSYTLPLGFSGPIQEVSIRIAVEQEESRPSAERDGGLSLRFERWRQGWVAEKRGRELRLDSSLVVALPKVARERVWVERDPTGQHYFYAAGFPRLGDAPSRRVAAPRHVTVLWDASGSRIAVDHERELELLRLFFSHNASPRVDVDLVTFSNTAEAPRRYVVEHGEAGELLTAIKAVAYDGGTQMGALPPGSGAAVPDLYLLFSDGLSTFGGAEPGAFAAPVYAFAVSPSANAALLRRVAATSGGAFVDLVVEDAAAAVARIGQAQSRLAGIETDGGAVSALQPAVPVVAGERVMVTGRLQASRTAITLHYDRGGQRTRAERFEVEAATATEGTLVRTFWAQQRLAELVAAPQRNARELVKLGRAYGLVTPGTSLMVLESLEQYVRYEIEPPATLPEMQQQYARIISARTKDAADSQQTHLDTLLGLWQERLDWWGTDFAAQLERQRVATPRPPTPTSPVATPTPPRPTPAATRQPTATTPPRAHRHRPRAPRPTGDEGVVGVVVDNQDEPLPGVTVTISGLTLARPRTVVSNSAGRFAFRSLAPGEYSLRAESQGFVTQEYRNVRVGARRGIGMVIVVPPSQVTEEVTVTGSYEAVSTSAQVATTYEVNGVEGVEGGVEDGDPSHGTGAPAQTSSIQLEAWDPDTPYLDDLREAPDKHLEAVYLALRAKHGSSAGFFLDCADLFLERGDRPRALRVLSNLAELELEDAGLWRILGTRLAQLGELEASQQAFEAVLDMRPEEPQSHRDLALVLARRGVYQRAVELLTHVVMTEWPRFDEIEVIALEELSAVLPKARAAGVAAPALDPRLLRVLDVDLRVVLTWDADLTDMDLWVVEPSGEKAMYNHNRTAAGGLVSRDFTQGYGPEEYLIRRAQPGAYKIQVDYYGTSARKILGPVTLQVEMITNYGRPNEERRARTLRLASAKEVVDVGEVAFGTSK